jgi:hypothetical protein
MTKAVRLNLLKELVQELDYDLYKGMFIKLYIEEPEENEERINSLLELIESYEK